MNRPEKVISVNEVDQRIIERIQDVLSTALARSLVRKAIKEVCGEKDDM